MIVFFRDGHFEGDHAWLGVDDLVPDPDVPATLADDEGE